LPPIETKEWVDIRSRAIQFLKRYSVDGCIEGMVEEETNIK
jgi:hypothetical protein